MGTTSVKRSHSSKGVKKLTEKKVRVLKVLYLSGIFVGIFIFFTQIHPLVIFDTDDWISIALKRHPIPLWGKWNPTRVFPEVLMPLCGDIAAFFVYPLTRNYIRSFTLVNGAVVALFVVLYMHMFFELLYKKWKLSAFRTFALSTIFLILHFIVFRTVRISDTTSDYLFLAPNVTCYYYYVIPALLNCSLVLYLLRSDVLYDGWRKLKSGTFAKHIVRNSILFLALYFALFSNLYQSVILAAFIGSQLLLELIGFIKAKGNFNDFKELVKTNTLRLMFIFSWAIEQVFEVNGGRAASIRSGGLLQSVMSMVKSMLNKVISMNKLFLFGSIVVFISAMTIAIYCHVKKSPKIAWGGVHRLAAILSTSEAFIIVYLILLCSRTGAIGRSDIWLSIMFFVFLGIMLCGSYILSKINIFDLLLPFICIFLVCETRTSGRTFSDTKMGGVDNSTCVEIDNDIVSQFVEADESGENEIVLYVPEFGSADNFPLATYGGTSISRALYKHGVIDHPITVTEMVPTREKNEQFNFG